MIRHRLSSSSWIASGKLCKRIHWLGIADSVPATSTFIRLLQNGSGHPIAHNAGHATLTLIRLANMNRIFYIIGVIVVIVIVLKLLGLF
jgi:hypothetical protein